MGGKNFPFNTDGKNIFGERTEMIRFVIDSTFGVSREYAQQHGVKIVDLTLILDGVQTPEGFEDNWDEFYQRYKKSSSFPTTSQPNPENYKAAINEILSEDADAKIIILTIASGLSGTVNSARLASTEYENVTVIDTMNASFCSKMFLEELVEFVASNENIDDILLFSENLKERLSFQFVPDTMKYLHKGGRVGTLSAILASVIVIKPIFDFRKNITSVTGKVLGLSKAIKDMIKNLPQKIKKITIGYIYDNKNIQLIKEKLEELRGIINPKVSAICPVFGIHVGVGAIGIACLAE